MLNVSSYLAFLRLQTLVEARLEVATALEFFLNSCQVTEDMRYQIEPGVMTRPISTITKILGSRKCIHQQPFRCCLLGYSQPLMA